MPYPVLLLLPHCRMPIDARQVAMAPMTRRSSSAGRPNYPAGKQQGTLHEVTDT